MLRASIRFIAGLLLVLAIVSITWRVTHERGRVEAVECDSASAGGKRRMLVYLPPGSSEHASYPVLYLLHGAGDDETAWHKHGSVHVILDRLHAEKKLIPMIVVMPNCFVPAESGRTLANELLEDVMPYVDSHYTTQADRNGRAIAGLSMGGGRALEIGLKHRDTFAWIGAFSPSLSGKAPRDVIADPSAGTGKLKLLWLSCGDEDHLLGLSKELRTALEEHKIAHVWHSGSGGHEWKVWKDDLRLFAQRLFRE